MSAEPTRLAAEDLPPDPICPDCSVVVENLGTDGQFIVGVRHCQRASTAEGLAEALRISASKLHWQLNHHAGTVQFEDCDRELCATARAALAKYEGKGQVNG